MKRPASTTPSTAALPPGVFFVATELTRGATTRSKMRLPNSCRDLLYALNAYRSHGPPPPSPHHHPLHLTASTTRHGEPRGPLQLHGYDGCRRTRYEPCMSIGQVLTWVVAGIGRGDETPQGHRPCLKEGVDWGGSEQTLPLSGGITRRIPATCGWELGLTASGVRCFIEERLAEPLSIDLGGGKPASFLIKILHKNYHTHHYPWGGLCLGDAPRCQRPPATQTEMMRRRTATQPRRSATLYTDKLRNPASFPRCASVDPRPESI